MLARFQRLMGREVRFQTGTDEHGLKMAQKARELGVSPRELAKEMSGYFQELFDKLDISYDRFIRTTEAEHHRASQAIWQAMEASGDLYLVRYAGWYSVRDEAYSTKANWSKGRGKLSPQPRRSNDVEEVGSSAVEYRSRCSRSIATTRLRAARDEPQRGHRFVEAGCRSFGQPHQFDWASRCTARKSTLCTLGDALTNP